MFFLERREKPMRCVNVGGHSFKVPVYHWKAIYTCPERWPLEDILSKLDKRNYRITQRKQRGNRKWKPRN